MKVLKKFAAVVAALTLTVAMGTTCLAATWGSYFGQNSGWYEGAYGSLTEESATGWTAQMDQIGWGGCWGGQVFLESGVSVKKGTEYTLKFNMKSSTVDKWVFIKIATGDEIAYGDWIQVKAGKTTKVDVTFKAACDADSLYFGIGGEFGDREDGSNEAKGAIYQYAEGDLPNDVDSTYATTLTCTDFSFGEKAAAATESTDDNGGSDTKTTSNTTAASEGNGSSSTTVATGDFAPIACATVAVLAAAVVVVFSRKREEA